MANMAAAAASRLLITPKHHLGSLVATNTVAPFSTDVKTIKNPRLSDLKRGTGGRSSFNGIVATVFGASGFLGRYVCNRLGKLGTQVIIPYRGDHYDVLRLKLVGDLGQVLFVPYNLNDEDSIRKAVKYSNVVINLVGRDWETKNFKFEDVHVKGARRIAKIARESGVEKFIHVSALNANPHPKPIISPKGSKFLESKWHGENAVREEFPEAVIFRPSDIYGQEDRFLRYYAHRLRRQFNMVPVWKKGEHTVKQPVYVSDVAAGIVNAARDSDVTGTIFQAVGPKSYLLSELVDWFYRILRVEEVGGYLRYDMRFDPFFLARVLITSNGSLSWPPGYLHIEGLEKEHTSDVVKEGIPSLEDLGVTLTHMEDQVPYELRPLRAGAYYLEELGEFAPPDPPTPLSTYKHA